MNSMVRPRRLFVTGGSRLSPNASLLWNELGKLLAEEKGLVVITGGLEVWDEAEKKKSADLAVVEGFTEVLERVGVDPMFRLETYLPDPGLDSSKLKRFRKGRVYTLHNRTAQSRRFRMVHAADVVISIEGEHGTRSVLDMAMAIERPMLPLPFGGGISEEVWGKEKSEICAAFQITPLEAHGFDNLRLGSLDAESVRAVAAQVRLCLLRGFTRSCFVIMPFHEDYDPVYEKVIQPALVRYGLKSFRTDKNVGAGNIVEAIRDGIEHCYLAIADISGDRPNVMYELGMAHAHHKPVILLRRNDSGAVDKSVPFDVATERVLPYGSDLAGLRRDLELAIEMISGRTPLGDATGAAAP